eukprot:403356973
MEDDRLKIKIVVIGDGGVGKSSFCQKILMGQNYNPNNDENLYKPTIASDFFTRVLQLQNQKHVQLNFWDLSGHPEFYQQRLRFYGGTHILIYMYDLSFKDSFENLNEWHREYITEMNSHPIHTYIIGNKVERQRDRFLEQFEIDNFCKNKGIKAHFSTSVYESKQIKELQ